MRARPRCPVGRLCNHLQQDPAQMDDYVRARSSVVFDHVCSAFRLHPICLVSHVQVGLAQLLHQGLGVFRDGLVIVDRPR
eukprot:scaffold259_cov252-Pinguiococcus_pyrenoidosus.AAC.13